MNILKNKNHFTFSHFKPNWTKIQFFLYFRNNLMNFKIREKIRLDITSLHYSQNPSILSLKNVHSLSLQVPVWAVWRGGSAGVPVSRAGHVPSATQQSHTPVRHCPRLLSGRYSQNNFLGPREIRQDLLYFTDSLNTPMESIQRYRTLFAYYRSNFSSR